ncbi:uncharacterized protein LOC132314725 [Cornus florida]|uniref:uncharacterized protein LOC132314725 n=1 Tax=Cornus florida TaxID=4283 RepID=UPI0028989B7F|nr:uncharacterized protein LOC132314725 [Cornus florida]
MGGPSQFQGQQSARSAPPTPLPAGSDRSAVVCFQCQQPGHYKSSCPMRLTLVSSAPKACYGCGQQGHLIRDCPSQGAGTTSGRGTRQRPSQSATISSSQAQTPQGRVFALAPTDASPGSSVLREGGVSVDPSEIETVLNWE